MTNRMRGVGTLVVAFVTTLTILATVPAHAIDQTAIATEAPVPETEGLATSPPAPTTQPLTTFTTAILSPEANAVLPADTTEVAYRVQVATAGDYWLDLACEGESQGSSYIEAWQDGQQFVGSLGQTSSGDACSLWMHSAGGGTGEDLLDFTVEDHPIVQPEVRNPLASPHTFFPRVRDGYRDSTNISFGVRMDSDVQVRFIRDAGGYAVRSFVLEGWAGDDHYSRRDVTWNGRNNQGNLVPDGRYTVTITSTPDDGGSASARVPVWVDSGFRNVRVTKVADGWYDSIDRTTSDCYSDQVPDGNDLDCWGGAYAMATYWFALPSSAHNVDWAVRGYYECCDEGRVTKTGLRDSNWFRVRVKVTGWRSFVVRSTSVTYSYSKAI